MLGVGAYPLYNKGRLKRTVAYASRCTSNRRFGLIHYSSYNFVFARNTPIRTRVKQCCRAPSCVSRASVHGKLVGHMCRRMHGCVLSHGTGLVGQASNLDGNALLSVNANAKCFDGAVGRHK